MDGISFMGKPTSEAGHETIEEAVRLMLGALDILDRGSVRIAAATLSLAIEQAGGTAPPPRAT